MISAIEPFFESYVTPTEAIWTYFLGMTFFLRSSVSHATTPGMCVSSRLPRITSKSLHICRHGSTDAGTNCGTAFFGVLPARQSVICSEKAFTLPSLPKKSPPVEEKPVTLFSSRLKINLRDCNVKSSAWLSGRGISLFFAVVIVGCSHAGIFSAHTYLPSFRKTRLSISVSNRFSPIAYTLTRSPSHPVPVPVSFLVEALSSKPISVTSHRAASA